MLDDRYFADLGRPDDSRLTLLPLWAQRYELELRLIASWWHDARRGRPVRPCPALKWQSEDRLFKLPVWAFEWFNDLRFEIYWWRSKAAPADEPTSHHRQVSRPYRPTTSFEGITP